MKQIVMSYYYEVRDKMPYVDRLVTYIDEELYKEIRKEVRNELSDPKDAWQYVFDNALSNSDINTDNWGNHYVIDVELFIKNKHSHLV